MPVPRWLLPGWLSPGWLRSRPPHPFGACVLAGLIPASLFVILCLANIVPLWLTALCVLTCFIWSVMLETLLADDVGKIAKLIRAIQTDQAALPEAIRFRLPEMRRLSQDLAQLLHLERRRRAKLADGAASSQILLERLPDALFQIGGAPGGRHVVWRNPAAITAFGSEESALLRHPALRAAIINAETAAAPARVSLSLSAPVTRDLEVTIIKAGAIKPNHPHASAPLYLLIADRTQERGLDRMRADFVANASHELRTPLTSLIGFIETLRGPAADDAEAGRRFLAIMAEQASRMQLVISDLLHLSRIEMGEHQPPEDSIDLAPLLNRVTDGMEPMWRAAAVTIVRDLTPNLPRITGDAGQLAQVFTNLLDNAIKYGRHGGHITVSAGQAADPRLPPGGVIVTVADDGQGISRAHLPRLTERFYRVDKARSRAVGGTGLGLAIVKHVINRHRGRLLIDSTEGQGTTCLVWLPLARDAARPV
jgi:two-component system phosphate regulon sensor histidine kinase PhoR